MANFIEVTGPNQAGEFVAKSPDGETSLVIYWEDLEALKQSWGTEQVQGVALDLGHRLRPVSAPTFAD